MSDLTTGTQAQRTITAFFDQRSEAERAVERLIGIGIPRSSVRIVQGAERGTSGGTSVSAQSSHELGFWDALKDLFLPDDDRSTYAEGLRRGGYLVTAQTDSARAEKALDILDDEGTIDIDQRAQTWRSEGWTGRPATGVGATGAMQGSQGLAGSTSRTNTSATSGQQATGLAAGRDEVIPVAEERLQVGKRDVSHGRIRVRSYVVETPVQEQVALREEHVSIERRPVDRAATGTDNLFKERTIVAEERAEEAVIAKEARVKEELVVHKEAGQRTQTVSDTVRRTEVEVEDERGNKVNTPGRQAR